MAQFFCLTRGLLAAALVAVSVACPAAGQTSKLDPAKILGQTPENGSLPLSSKPAADARQELGQKARDYERGIFLVGYRTELVVAMGTAWVISKKHRLLVTNAHVADSLHESGGKMMGLLEISDSRFCDLCVAERKIFEPGEILQRFKRLVVDTRS